MSRLSVKGKVYAIVGVLVVLSAIIVVVAYLAMSDIRESTREIDTVSRRLNEMSAARSIMQTVATDVREVALANNDGKMRELKAGIEKAVDLLDKDMGEIGAITRLPNEWRELTNTWNKHKDVAARIIDLSLQDTNGKAAAMVTNECNPLRQKEAELFRTVFSDQVGIESISTLMLSVPTDVREVVLAADVARMQEIRKEIESNVGEIDARMAELAPKVSNKSDWKILEDT